MNVCITLDSDWAHQDVASFAIERMLLYGKPFTYFATYDQKVGSNNKFEVAIHPDFTAHDPVIELKRLCDRFPNAIGLRPHRLEMIGVEYKDILIESGMHWVSSYYSPEPGAITRWAGTLPNVPVNWGDNRFMLYGERPNCVDDAISSCSPMTFNFHPIHLYLNTCCPDQYKEAKKGYHDIAHLRQCRQNKEYGVLDVLQELIAHCDTHQFVTVTEAVKGRVK